MVSDEQVRAIALFFLLSLMDEKVALQASEKVIANLKTKKARAETESVSDEALIQVLRQSHDQHRHLVPRNRATDAPQAAWDLPDKFDLVPWIKFQREAGENEILAVVLSRVLGFKDDVIASGLNVSLGTARYRIGKGMRQLGVHARGARV